MQLEDRIINIDIENKFIFLHIPKTGGWTIKNSFGLLKKGITPKHPKFRDIIAEVPNLEEYFTFTVMRNPWLRWYSVYKHSELVVERDSRPKLPPFQDWIHAEDKHLSQFWWIESDSNIQINYIANIHDIDNDINTICDKVGIPRKKVLTRHRRPENKTYLYKEYYNKDLREFVAAGAKKEIELFGYQFDDPEICITYNQVGLHLKD